MYSGDYIEEKLTEEDKEEIENNKIWQAVNEIILLCIEHDEISKAIDYLNDADRFVPRILFERKDKIDEIIFNYIKEGV
jgi:hypothetical protein